MFTPLRRLCNRNTANLLLNYSRQCKLSTLCTNQVVPFCSSKYLLLSANQNRFKSKKPKNRQKPQTETETEGDESQDDLDRLPDKHTKVIKVRVTSLRVDALLKGALGIARNKIETLFYESKIRVNAKKVLKKSAPIAEGDEIDVIKGVSSTNPDFLVVARVEVLSIRAEEEAIVIKVRRYKSLNIENYEDKWQP